MPTLSTKMALWTQKEARKKTTVTTDAGIKTQGKEASIDTSANIHIANFTTSENT